jgi:hypothetical protein
MALCPNCGRSTARTEDWACQWCGYPLLSGSYKKIPKTYRDLQVERLYEPLVEEEARASLSPEPASELEPVEEPEEWTKPAFESRVAEELETRLAGVPKPESVPEPELVGEPEPVRESEFVRELEPEPAPELLTADMKVTVEELVRAYEEEGVAADARFAGKILDLVGVVSRVKISEALDVHYIILASVDQTILQTVRCVFSKKHEAELGQLMPGQAVTVRGRYDGSIIDIRLKDCTLVG